MRQAIIASVLAALLALNSTEAQATTVFPAEQKCPACSETSITTAIGSYYSFGEPERDLSDSPFVRFGGVEVCPYCLYSSLKSDFESLSTKEREVLRAKLPLTRATLQEPERAALLGCPDESWLRGEHFFGLLIARECYSFRASDGKRDMRLLLHLYYATKEDRHADLHRHYRSECIDTLSGLLASGAYEGGEKAVLTYLLGELNRLNGRHEEAIRIFEHATKVAKALPQPKDEDDESFDWVPQWAFEQTCRIQFATNSVRALAPFINAPESEEGSIDYRRETQRKVAIQTLASRHDPEAWGTLAEYVMEDPWRLDGLVSLTQLTSEKVRIDHRLWDWVEQRYQEALRQTAESEQDADLIWIRTKNQFGHLFNESKWDFLGSDADAQALASALADPTFAPAQCQYEVQPGDTLTSIASKHGVSVARLLELNPQISNPDKISATMKVWWLKMPCGWPEERVLGNLDRLIRAGQANAISFFLQWAETVGPHSFEEFDYRIGRCLAALSDVTSSWSVPPMEKLGANAQQAIIHDCLAMVHGESDAGQRLLPFVRSREEPEVSVVLSCMEATKSSLAKDVVLLRLKKEHDYDFDMHALSYLAAVATTNALPALKKIAIARCPNLKGRQYRDMAGFHRQDIEDTIMRIRLRGVLQRSLGK